MFKKFVLILSVCLFLFGMATRKEKENLEKTVKAESTAIAESTTMAEATVNIGVMTTESAKGTETNYQISAASVSKVAAGDTITHVIFGETEMMVSEARALGVGGLEQERSDEKVRVKYPQVVMVSDKKEVRDYGAPMVESVKFFDLSGKVKKEVFVKDVFPKDKDGICWVDITNNHKYFALYTHVNFAIKTKYQVKEESKSQVVVFDVNGSKLWEIKETEVPLTVYLSPDGEYLVGAPDTEWGGPSVFVYNKKGEILKKIEKEEGFDISFSKDGSYFAVLVEKIDWEMKTEIHSDRHSADLVVVNAQGNELWRKEKIVRGWEASGAEVKMSADTIIVMTGEYKVYYFNKEGKSLKTEQSDVKQFGNFKDY